MTIPTLWLIGDSTVRLGEGDGVGWGEVLGEHFDLGRLRIDNRAMPARSSRTFRSEGRWADVLGLAKPGDFVMLQFDRAPWVATGARGGSRRRRRWCSSCSTR